MISGYLARTSARALNQLLFLFGGVLTLAFLLCMVAEQIRGAGVSVFGKGYYYFVAPGVVCHETGHALGCLATGTRIVRFEPFHPREGSLGQVVAEQAEGSLWGQLAMVVIGFGPVWFGCCMIGFLAKRVAKGWTIPDSGEIFLPDAILSSASYWKQVCKAGWAMSRQVFRWKNWCSARNVICLYLVFCIASEMGLSSADLIAMRMGLLCVCGLFAAVNLVPALGMATSRFAFRVSRRLFPVHALMVAVLMLDSLFVLLLVLPLRLATGVW